MDEESSHDPGLTLEDGGKNLHLLSVICVKYLAAHQGGVFLELRGKDLLGHDVATQHPQEMMTLTAEPASRHGINEFHPDGFGFLVEVRRRRRTLLAWQDRPASLS